MQFHCLELPIAVFHFLQTLLPKSNTFASFQLLKSYPACLLEFVKMVLNCTHCSIKLIFDLSEVATRIIIDKPKDSITHILRLRWEPSSSTIHLLAPIIHGFRSIIFISLSQ